MDWMMISCILLGTFVQHKRKNTRSWEQGGRKEQISYCWNLLQCSFSGPFPKLLVLFCYLLHVYFTFPPKDDSDLQPWTKHHKSPGRPIWVSRPMPFIFATTLWGSPTFAPWSPPNVSSTITRAHWLPLLRPRILFYIALMDSHNAAKPVSSTVALPWSGSSKTKADKKVAQDSI